jgi:hypothetical protein
VVGPRTKKYLGMVLFFVALTICQIIAVQVGQRAGDWMSYRKGLCKINGVWNGKESCDKKGVKGEVWDYRISSF